MAMPGTSVAVFETFCGSIGKFDVRNATSVPPACGVPAELDEVVDWLLDLVG
jgi:hypothetical protein